MANIVDEINLKDYTISNFTVSKLSVSTLEIVFLNEEQKSDYHTHGQLKCTNLNFPFAKKEGKFTPFTVKDASVLVDADRGRRVKEVQELVLDATFQNGSEQEFLSVLHFSPGDTIAIIPHNAVNEVSLLLEKTEMVDKADLPCYVQAHPSSTKKCPKLNHIPDCTSPRELLRDLLSIRALPKKQFLRSLASYCSSNDEQNFLNCLASKEGSHLYNELILEKGLNLLDLLKMCSSCKPTLSLLIENLPRLLPRPYSIANSPINGRNEIKIIYSISNHQPGVTTSMLSSIAKSIIQKQLTKPPTLHLYPRESNKFRYEDSDYSNNQILVAIGTGMAPFLGFLEHKVFMLNKNKDKPGSTWLFVGATVEAAIPHREEIKELIRKYKRQVIERYFESFSCEPEKEFRYIQDQFVAHAEELVIFLLKNDTTLYVCADGSRISQAIESSLCLCLQQQLEIGPDIAKEMLTQFRSSGKYREETWT